MTQTLQTKTQTRPVLQAAEPQLYVSNVTAACDFYAQKLGFTVAFIYGDPPFYAQVFRDGARLNLRHVDQPVFAGDVRQREALLSATVTVASVAEIKELFADYQSAGVKFKQSLKKESWGATTFVASDPDENLILFAGPAE
jgi:catechol 2,3-dioxygenase-like lactoylglutathione lyase family enzyme